jgi:hypothetical protein
MNVARRLLNRVNVPIEPSANSASKVTNNSMINSGERVKYRQVSVFESPLEERPFNFDKTLSHRYIKKFDSEEIRFCYLIFCPIIKILEQKTIRRTHLCKD